MALYPYKENILVFSYYKREYHMTDWQRQLKIPELKMMGSKTAKGWCSK